MGKPTRSQRRLVIWVSLIVYAVLISWLFRERYSVVRVEEAPPNPVVVSQPEPQKTPVAPTVPASALLEVPFMVQAPFGVWDALHQETCEEASLMMVHAFRTERSLGTLQTIDDELKALVAWQTARGYEYDVTLAELSRIARDYYSMNTGRIITNPTITDIQSEIAAGRPVIVPAAGRLLENPNFTRGGPSYHMLVVRGYDANGFITNDPGTRRGEKFRYSYKNLMDSIRDWTGSKATILSGAKAVLVFD